MAALYRGSFRGVFAQVVFYLAKPDPLLGEKVEFWAPKHPWITSVQWTSSRGFVSSLSVGIDMPYREGIELLGGNLFAQGTVIEARIGYTDTGETTPWQRGILYSGGLGLAVTADGVSGTLEAKPFGTVKKDAVAAKFDKNTTRTNLKRVLEVLAEQMGGEVILDTSSLDLLTSIQGNKTANPYYDGWEPGVSDAMASFQEFLNKFGLTYHSWRVKRGNKIVSVFNVVPRLTGAGTDYRLVMRGAFAPEDSQWPLLEFSPELQPATFGWVEQDALAKGVTAAGIDAETGDLVEEHVSHAEVVALPDLEPDPMSKYGLEYIGRLGAVTGKDSTNPETGDKINSSAVSAVRIQSTSREAAVALARQAHPELSANLVTFGIPDTMIGKRIEVAGCSSRLDGTYFIERETQAYAPGDWKTTLVGRNVFQPGNAEGETAKAGSAPGG